MSSQRNQPSTSSRTATSLKTYINGDAPPSGSGGARGGSKRHKNSRSQSKYAPPSAGEGGPSESAAGESGGQGQDKVLEDAAREAIAKLREAGPVVGQQGQEALKKLIGGAHPDQQIKYVEVVYEELGLQEQDCKVLMGLVDELEISRVEMYQSMLNTSVNTLIDRIPTLPASVQEQILRQSLPYIQYKQLNKVPLGILKHMKDVPYDIIQQLPSDQNVISHMCENSRRILLEMHPVLITDHITTFIVQYTYHPSSVLRVMNMNCTIKHVLHDVLQNNVAQNNAQNKNVLVTGLHKQQIREEDEKLISRFDIRTHCPPLTQLASLIGPSELLYNKTIDIILEHIKGCVDVKDAVKLFSLCMLRGQLVMTCHDMGLTDVCEQDPCYKVAWILEACAKEGCVKEAFMEELDDVLQPIIATLTPPKTKKRRHHHDDPVHASKSTQQHSLNVLCQIGVMLSDPVMITLIVQGILQCLSIINDGQAALEQGDEQDELVQHQQTQLHFLSQLLMLALQGRHHLSTTLTSNRPPPDLLSVPSSLTDDLYPRILAYMSTTAQPGGGVGGGAAAASGTVGEDQDDEGEELELDDMELIKLLQQEAPRIVYQAYILFTLRPPTTKAATLPLLYLIHAYSNTPEEISENQVDYVPFAHNLVQLYRSLLSQKALFVHSPLITLSLTCLVGKLVHTHPSILEELLVFCITYGARVAAPVLKGFLAEGVTGFHVALADAERIAGDPEFAMQIREIEDEFVLAGMVEWGECGVARLLELFGGMRPEVVAGDGGGVEGDKNEG